MGEFYQQCTAATIKKPEGPACGVRYKVKAFNHACSLPRGHEGSHCEEKQCGDAVTRFWWDRTKYEEEAWGS